MTENKTPRRHSRCLVALWFISIYNQWPKRKCHGIKHDLERIFFCQLPKIQRVGALVDFWDLVTVTVGVEVVGATVACATVGVAVGDKVVGASVPLPALRRRWIPACWCIENRKVSDVMLDTPRCHWKSVRKGSSLAQVLSRLAIDSWQITYRLDTSRFASRNRTSDEESYDDFVGKVHVDGFRVSDLCVFKIVRFSIPKICQPEFACAKAKSAANTLAQCLQIANMLVEDWTWTLMSETLWTWRTRLNLSKIGWPWMFPWFLFPQRVFNEHNYGESLNGKTRATLLCLICYKQFDDIHQHKWLRWSV